MQLQSIWISASRALVALSSSRAASVWQWGMLSSLPIKLRKFVVGCIQEVGDIRDVVIKPLGTYIDIATLYLGFKGILVGNKPVLASIDAAIMTFHAALIVQLLPMLGIDIGNGLSGQ